jgi:hypothetical protein
MHAVWRPLASFTMVIAALGALHQSDASAPPVSPRVRPQDPPADTFTAVVEAFLASDQSDAAQKELAVEALLGTPDRSLPWLGQRLRALAVDDESPRSKGTRALAADVLLGFIEQKRRSGVVYRGQYAMLDALQPFASKLLFEWLLHTPFWLPDTQRVTLVPAIADLQATPPDPQLLLGVTDIVENIEGEPEDLRFALSCLAWQWGRKQYVQARAAQLQKDSADGDAEDRILAFRELSNLWYRVQENRRAATTHGAMTTIAERSNYELLPTDWYWGACYNALAGRVDAGFVALGRCVDLQVAANVDPVRKLPRALFDTDPELAALRADPRFLPLLQRAFPEPAEAAKGR